LRRPSTWPKFLTSLLDALGHRAAVVGLTRLVVDRELSAEAVNRQLRG
jgi:hypothetical protein